MSARAMKRCVPRCLPALLVALLLAGCATPGPAPVSDRPVPGAPRAAAKPEPVPAPAGALPKPDSGVVAKPLASGDVPMYTVKQGDTLFAIAKTHNLPVRDLATWNNIDDPGNISVGQQLRMGPPDGVTATPVKPLAPVEAKPLGATVGAITGAAGGEAPPRTADGAVRTQPLGQRVPYSDQAYAQMAKSSAAKPDPKADAKPEVKPEPKPDATAGAKPDAKAAAKPDPAADGAWMWPTEGKVVGNFNESSNKGITIAGKRGQPVYASAAGRVIFSGTGLRGLGRLIVIRHNNNYLSVYAHNDKLLVKEGQNVTKGQRIAEMGSTDSDSVKLHFEIRRQGKPVDPTKLLPST